MDEDIKMISQVTMGLDHWTAKITITEVMPTLVGYQRGTRYKRYIFTDDQGDTIPAIVYGSTISMFEEVLHLHHVYKISNAVIKPPTGHQSINGYPTHWVLQRSTLIRPMLEEQPNLRYFLDGIRPLSLITHQMAIDEVITDIMAVVIKATDSKEVTTAFGKGVVQSFTIVDRALKPMTLSVWGQQVEQVGHVLTLAAVSFSVIVVKRAKVKNYRGPTLTVNNGTSITVAPPIEAVTTLKSWFDSVRDVELPHLLLDYSLSYSKEMVDNNMVKKYSVGELVKNDQCGEFWARVFLQPTKENQRLYYIGCDSCLTKVDSLAGVTYRCLSCKKEVKASLRVKVSMEVYDHSGSLTVGAIDKVAEDILKCNAAELTTLMEEGGSVDMETIASNFEDKMYLVLLRRTHNRMVDAPKRLLLAAYYDDTVSTDENSSSNTTNTSSTSASKNIVEANEAHLPAGSSQPVEAATKISPLKRQFDSITIVPGTPTKRMLFEDDVGAHASNKLAETSKEETNDQSISPSKPKTQ